MIVCQHFILFWAIKTLNMDVWIINLIESINHSTGYLVIEWKEE